MAGRQAYTQIDRNQSSGDLYRPIEISPRGIHVSFFTDVWVSDTIVRISAYKLFTVFDEV